ncbi:MAG TPA: circadian clock KaiB family protein, partial [Polyangiaceae bacterium]|nr:circadian clock KaiB family protein [Polyangiaceae bacterium]
GSAASRRAVRNAERVLRAHPPSLARLSVRDMAEFADEAAADRVDFTPALVRLRPAPRALLLGDLRDASALEELLRDAEPESAR